MTKEKQIEEMQEMASILTEASHMACEDIPLLPTDMTICDKIQCHRCKETRLLSYKGYRKASELAEEIFEEFKRYISPHKIGAFNCIYINDVIAELKKKYTEGEV
jgi:hypothetical protein